MSNADEGWQHNLDMLELGERIGHVVSSDVSENTRDYLNRYFFAQEGSLLLGLAANAALRHNHELPTEILQFANDDDLVYSLVDDIKAHFAERGIAA